ncbi:uncharacterized protein LOC144881128 [Branchiostoma floridae x Branchiostoma japonicum]
MAAGIAVLLSLIAMGFALLAFINNEEMTTAVDAFKHNQGQLSTTVNTLKRDQDNMSTTVALKCGQDDMRQLSTTVDALKRDLDKERSRTAALAQRLYEMSKTLGKYIS